jgi:hypothetical protein
MITKEQIIEQYGLKLNLDLINEEGKAILLIVAQKEGYKTIDEMNESQTKKFEKGVDLFLSLKNKLVAVKLDEFTPIKPLRVLNILYSEATKKFLIITEKNIILSFGGAFFAPLGENKEFYFNNVGFKIID